MGPICQMWGKFTSDSGTTVSKGAISLSVRIRRRQRRQICSDESVKLYPLCESGWKSANVVWDSFRNVTDMSVVHLWSASWVTPLKNSGVELNDKYPARSYSMWIRSDRLQRENLQIWNHVESIFPSYLDRMKECPTNSTKCEENLDISKSTIFQKSSSSSLPWFMF